MPHRLAPPIVSVNPDKISGYLLKHEHRSIGGPSKKKYWFVLDTDSPFLYWFKAATDITCVGRIALSGAAFTFDPRHKGQFEIHANGEIHVFEALDNKARSLWLQFLQKNRRRHYERENVDSILNVEIMTPASHSNLSNLGKLSTLHAVDAVTTIPEESPSTSTSATMSPVGGSDNHHPSDTRFYLGTDGELIASSFDLPSVPPAAPNRDLIKSAERVLTRIADGTHSRASILEEDAKKAIGKARRSIRLPSFATREKEKPKCEQCVELATLVEDLKDRCFELTDEVAANQDLVCALRNALVSAHNQRDAVMKVHSISEIEQLNFIIERESKLTNLQISNAELKREVQSLRETEKTLTRENQHLQTAIDAFKTSVITKDELIMKMCETQDDMEKRHREHRASYADVGDIGIPEAIPVDGGLSPEEATRIVTEEVDVDDVYELRDLVLGYESQNKFLNNEVLELQHIVDGLEARERKIIRQNFEIEAWFYQLKSRYMMVLNHVRNGFDEAQKKLPAAVIEELIDDVNRPLKFQHRTDGVSSLKPSLSVILNSTAEGSETDALGFFIKSPKFGSPKASIAGNHEQPTPSRLTVSESSEVIVDKAAQLKNLSDQILKNIQTEESKQYLDWLQKWDCFLVNHASASQLASSPDLKALVRQGVPHTYRSRVWKCLVQIHVADAQADAGKGYYECLLRKADKLEDPSTDGSLRQIDLDLARTLPNNIHFTDVNSEKMLSLKRVLYAFRFHCKSVEYCQGLNRIAAVALLYLREDDAFWFLVAVVEYLQPAGYYTNTLHGAIIDQKVMMDLVQEWVPKVHHHLKSLEVDLSLFTLPWFLTIFVDVLSHDLYLPIFDAYLLEGNKVIFRFALGLLRTLEPRILACTTVGAVHSCLSSLTTLECTPKDLAKAAFHDLYSFPAKSIETKRVHYASQSAKK